MPVTVTEEFCSYRPWRKARRWHLLSFDWGKVCLADTGGSSETDVNTSPTDTPAIELALVVPADAVAYLVEVGQHLDVQIG